MKSSKIVEITPQQRKFCELLILYDGDWTATQCAIEAGYSENSARQIASQLQNREKYPKVYDYILELREEQHKKYHVNYNRHMRRLKHLSQAAEDKGNYTAAVSAEISRGKAAGLYVDRKEILTGSIDNMAKDEVEKRLADLKKRFPKVINAVAIEEKESGEREKSLEKNST
jgi:phage terminase small subunit|tara:strand:+ start:195 stop:710 length:516 start_codon:yes stop_codon:yes gene_type:complete